MVVATVAVRVVAEKAVGVRVAGLEAAAMVVVMVAVKEVAGLAAAVRAPGSVRQRLLESMRS